MNVEDFIRVSGVNRYIANHTLTELDKALDHGPIAILLDQGALRYEIRKEHYVTTEGRHYALYQIAQFKHGEWKSLFGGYHSLDEVVLSLAFPHGQLEG